MLRVTTMPQSGAVQAPNALGLIATWLLLFGLAVGNSALFIFVAWQEFDPTNTYSVVLFFVSGAAHLLYFVLPWYMRELIAPALELGSDGYQAQGQASPSGAGWCTLLGLFTTVGVVLSILAFGLWVFHTNLNLEWVAGRSVPELAVITEANCTLIGGTTEYRGGHLFCAIE